jgi:hypothetical protein
MENSNRANRAGSVNYHVITSCPAVEDVRGEGQREIAFITLHQ